MMLAISGLKGFTILASDGQMGKVVDFLFDDSKGALRWLVVECGSWLRGRRVLVHPSAVSITNLDNQTFEVKMNKSQVEGSPLWISDEPVSSQMESRICDYYGWDPLWNVSIMEVNQGAMALPLVPPPYFGLAGVAADGETRSNAGDPHLRSIDEIVGYNIQANDGLIGHVENFMLDEADWTLPYLVVDTRNWGFGGHVLISRAAVTSIDWSDRCICLNVSREQVKASPAWDPLIAFDEIYRKRLHDHYGWPGSRS